MIRETGDIVFVEMSYIDYLLIIHIKEMRLNRNFTQLQLSQKMKLADGFVSKVETLTERAKYNIRHLPLLANAFSCSIQELIPRDKVRYDMVRITIQRTPKRNSDGSISKKNESKVIKVEAVL